MHKVSGEQPSVGYASFQEIASEPRLFFQDLP